MSASTNPYLFAEYFTTLDTVGKSSSSQHSTGWYTSGQPMVPQPHKMFVVSSFQDDFRGKGPMLNLLTSSWLPLKRLSSAGYSSHILEFHQLLADFLVAKKLTCYNCANYMALAI